MGYIKTGILRRMRSEAIERILLLLGTPAEDPPPPLLHRKYYRVRGVRAYYICQSGRWHVFGTLPPQQILDLGLATGLVRVDSLAGIRMCAPAFEPRLPPFLDLCGKILCGQKEPA